jgi:hypothetical protein
MWLARLLFPDAWSMGVCVGGGTGCWWGSENLLFPVKLPLVFDKLSSEQSLGLQPITDPKFVSRLACHYEICSDQNGNTVAA